MSLVSNLKGPRNCPSCCLPHFAEANTSVLGPEEGDSLPPSISAPAINVMETSFDEEDYPTEVTYSLMSSCKFVYYLLQAVPHSTYVGLLLYVVVDVYTCMYSDSYTHMLLQRVLLDRSVGKLGLSIIGGSEHASRIFGGGRPGVYISKVSLLNRHQQCVCFRCVW